jgi:hypothetical protein
MLVSAALLMAVMVAMDAAAQSTTAVVGGATALRGRPAIDAESVEVVPAGATVTVLRREGVWVFVTTSSGRQGYIHEQFLRIQGAAPSTPAAPATAAPSPQAPLPPAPAPRPTAPPPRAVARPSSGGPDIQLFADAGAFMPIAKESFAAVFDSNRVTAFGGGASAALGPVFVQASYRRATKTGQRVVILDDEVFGLGIPTELVTQPLNLTAGVKLRGPRLRPYLGGGLTLLSVKETAPFADEDDDVDERFTGAHGVAGTDFLVMSWLAVGAEVEYSTVKTKLDNSGVLAEFGEDDLGGWAFRARVAIGLFGTR